MPLRWLWASLVLAEVVDDLVAEREEAEQLAGAGGLARVEVLDRAAQLEQGGADLGALGDAALLERLDRGVCSSRLEVSAALRMSASPMLRTLAGLRGELRRPGLRVGQRVQEPVDLGVQRRHLRGVDLGRDRRRLGGGDRRAARARSGSASRPGPGASGAPVRRRRRHRSWGPILVFCVWPGQSTRSRVGDGSIAPWIPMRQGPLLRAVGC